MFFPLNQPRLHCNGFPSTLGTGGITIYLSYAVQVPQPGGLQKLCNYFANHFHPSLVFHKRIYSL